MVQVFGGAGHEGRRAGIFRVADVDDGEAARPRMRHIGEAAMDHHLKAVAAAALIGMADEAHGSRA